MSADQRPGSTPGSTAGSRAVYSVDRVRRLRVVLWLTLALGVFISVLEVGALGDADVDQQLTRIALGIYVVVAVLSAASLWLLARRDVVTRLSATCTGTFLAIVGVLTIAALVGWLSLLLGLGLLALAVLPDDPGAEP